MTWHVQYRKDTVEHIARHPGPEQATHCRFLPSLLAQKASSICKNDELGRIGQITIIHA
jgi:hypothetical protein